MHSLAGYSEFGPVALAWMARDDSANSRDEAVMIELTCQCGKVFRVKDELAGKRGKCPICGAVMQIPASARDVPAVDISPSLVRPGMFEKARKAALPIAVVLLLVVIVQAVVVARLDRQSRDAESQIIRLKVEAMAADERAERYAMELRNIRDAEDVAQRVEAEMHRMEEKEGSPLGRDPSTPEEIEEQRRLAKMLEDAFEVESVPPNSGNVPRKLERILDSVKMPGDENWLFKTEYIYQYPINEDHDLNEATDNRCYAFSGGILDPKPRSEGEYIWASQGANGAAYYYARHNLPDSDFEVDSIETNSPGSMLAVLRMRGSGEKWQLIVESYDRHRVVKMDD
jgi:hypothetical protein